MNHRFKNGSENKKGRKYVNVLINPQWISKFDPLNEIEPDIGPHAVSNSNNFFVLKFYHSFYVAF